MRLLYIDIDTLRADHLGCYGYHRNTSPNIDRIAASGVRFDNCFNSDAPCLPSRAGMFMGRHGIHTGIVNHGGTSADPLPEGAGRGFQNSARLWHWPMVMSRGGKYTVSVSPYAERHSAWWFYAGFREMHNTGLCGHERADQVVPVALDWLGRNGKNDDWFLHVNCWDPHTPYRTPMDYGNPFENDPPPAWITDEIIARHRQGYGPHSASEVQNWRGLEDGKWPRLPRQMKTAADFKKWIDGYDTGIHYADMHVGLILEKLAELGVLDDTAILVSSDHGENQGELNIYGDHHTADIITSRVPCVLKWPGVEPGVRDGLHYQSDIAATTLELWGMKVPASWDGRSFAGAFGASEDAGREFLVASQCAWSCQRMVLERNLAGEDRADVDRGLAMLEQWEFEMMQTSEYDIDPLWQVIREGGPLHTRGMLEPYCERLRKTGRAHHAEFLERQGGRPIDM